MARDDTNHNVIIMKKKQLFAALVMIMTVGMVYAQPAGRGQGGARPGGGAPRAMGGADESLVVNINTMDVQTRNRITEAADKIKASGGNTRGVFKDIGMSMLSGGVSGLVDVVVTETMNLIQYKKNQRQKWYAMIQNECNYTDSISSVKGLNDFYTEKSENGALDPSNINFDGISLRAMRNGQEVLYLSCHIDTTRLDHMFNHSKFYLVLDTMIFHPYACHLPNLQANGIDARTASESERDNRFSFDERRNLTVGMEMVLSSSWINEAVMVMDNVELGRFRLTVNIDRETDTFIYSRRQIEANRKARLNTDTTFVNVEGDCFVVPRSYMPLAEKRMWGTGEYNVKVKLRESCQWNNDEERNKKMKEWYKDYKQLRKMQRKGSLAGEYLKTVWQQHGNTLMKQMLKQGVTQSTTYLGLGQSGGMQGGMRGAAGASQGGAAGAGASGGGSGAPGGSPRGGR